MEITIIEIMKLLRNRKCEVVVLMMWLSFWHSQRTLGLTALSLTESDGAPTSCRAFLVRTLTPPPKSHTTRQNQIRKHIEQLISYYHIIIRSACLYTSFTALLCIAGYAFLLYPGIGGGRGYPPQKGQKWRFCRGSGGMAQKHEKYPPFLMNLP